MKIAGRCHCGVLLSMTKRYPADHRLCASGGYTPYPYCPGECGKRLTVVEREPDAHLQCFGLRWCGKCGDAAGYREDCLSCKRSRSLASYRRLSKAPDYLPRKRASERLKYRLDPAHAERQRQRQRRRYRTDPLYRAEKLAKQAEVRARSKDACTRRITPSTSPETSPKREILVGFEGVAAAQMQKRPLAPAAQSAHESTAA